MPQQIKQPKTKQEIIEQIKPILDKHDITKAGMYGSYARGDVDPDSDLDLLVSLGDETMDFIDLIGLQRKISEAINLKVDLTTFRAVSNRFKPYIKPDLFIFYNKENE